MIEYCNWGDCDEIGTEPFVRRFLCKKHKKEIPENIPGKPIPEICIQGLCSHKGCNAYAVYRISTKNDERNVLFEEDETFENVCAKHIFTPFVRSSGEVKRSRRIEQTKEVKKEKERLEMQDEEKENILFE